MKKWLISTFALVTIFTLAGCSNSNNSSTTSASSSVSKTYDNAMKDGKQAVKDGKYTKAEDYFKKALDEKKDDQKAKTYHQQVVDFEAANKAVKDQKFSVAKKDLDKVTDAKNGLSILNDKAKDLKTNLTTIENNVTDFNKTYGEAKTLSDGGRYSESNTKLMIILNNKEVDKAAYSSIKKKVNALRTANDTAIAKANSNAVASSSSSSNPAAGGEYAPSTDDTQLNGKEITKEQIAAARQQLKDQGVNPAYWSDLDIMYAIKKAAADGRTTITEADGQ